jgi:hypothetical protein
MTKRSIFLKHESFNDVMSALAKADTDLERRHLISERLIKNGWSKEQEIKFREHCHTCGFVLPFQRPKENPLGKDTQGRAKSRILADAVRNQWIQPQDG